MTGKEDSENYRITKLQLQLGFLGKLTKNLNIYIILFNYIYIIK